VELGDSSPCLGNSSWFGFSLDYRFRRLDVNDGQVLLVNYQREIRENAARNRFLSQAPVV